ncbi:hypothetical protein [Symbiobacterium terraclitae]|uniref:hypothetical protein n=1 Tax=Symbiobacterium terraclitae TaxID=557451 RepID=UPI0035B5504E
MVLIQRILGPAAFAFTFYFTHPAVWGLSLPVAALRMWQGYQPAARGAPYVVAELLVEGGRVLQLALVLAIGGAVSLRQMGSSATWLKILQGAGRMDFQEFVWELVGYALVVGLMNLALAALLQETHVAALLARLGLGALDPLRARQALLLGLKNLFVIPTSVIILFRMLRLV